MIRRYRFLEPVQVAVLSGRATGPRGGNGGEQGNLGDFTLHLPDGSPVALGPRTLSAPAGALLRVETPGGGGFGETT